MLDLVLSLPRVCMDICNTTSIDRIILFLQVLHILIQRAIVATEENKSVTSGTQVEDRGIQLTLSPILLSLQDSTDCPCGENCWYMQDPFRIMSNHCDMYTYQNTLTTPAST